MDVFKPLTVPNTIGLRYLIRNIELEPKVTPSGTQKIYQYSAYNLPAIKDEPMSPIRADVLPKVLFASNKFGLDDYKGDMSSWEALGQFNYQLNKGRDVLSPNMKANIWTRMKSL